MVVAAPAILLGRGCRQGIPLQALRLPSWGWSLIPLLSFVARDPRLPFVQAGRSFQWATPFS
ncbi:MULTISPECIES: hypothetical protein [unclassified Synechococcus]|uniref:hypothetical protein n=1 Tax=unclassified Synechococcus TaxID=2626047 RepID=UPI0039C224CB